MERKYTCIKKHIITQMFLQKEKLHYDFNQVCKKNNTEKPQTRRTALSYTTFIIWIFNDRS